MITLDKLLTELSSSSLNEIIAGHGHTNKNARSGSHSNSHSNSGSGAKKNKKKKNNAIGNGCCDSRSVIVLAPE